ncbi:MAG: ThuA domain-containing protein [Verrucomicrobiales bacterium]|nr:ThuA domain-containing protein [Verrucomicrobiales bacterium]
MKPLLSLRTLILSALTISVSFLHANSPDADHLVFEGSEGPGKGKHVVFLSGDEEYRSEEALPMLAQMLAKQGFKCSVLFSLNEDGTVNPDNGGSLSHPEALDTADILVLSLRFRHWDDKAMEHFEKAVNRGVALVSLRTSTHAFNFPKGSKWEKYSWRGPEELGWKNGFGRQVLGETWVSHHGKHKVEGCRSHVVEENKDHSILNGVGTIFVPSDVYGANPEQPSTYLLRGEVTTTLEPDSPGVEGKNDPMQPIAWTREYKHESGKTNQVFTTTMGASNDLLDENLRRLVLNSIFWGLGLEVPAKQNVTLPEGYNPSMFSFKGYKTGLRPVDFIPGAPAFEKASPPKQEPKKKKQAARAPGKLKIKKGDTIALVGAGMASRMMHFNHFETELYLRFPDKDLTIRNMGDEGNTPGFRPHPGRNHVDQYAFPGAKGLVPLEYRADSKPQGHFETPDQWLSRLGADTVLAFFGFNSSFRGPEDVDRYKKELEAFLKHTKGQKYNGKSTPQVALISPTAMQDLSAKYGTPDGKEANENLALYTKASKEVASANGVLFVDAFSPSKSWFSDGKEYTTDGALLSDLGYEKLAPVLADGLFGKAKVDDSMRSGIHAAVTEKNWFWHNDFKIPNGVHVYGRRYNPFGPENYPHELRKTREMNAIRDQAIWAALKGENFDIAAADAKTYQLPPVETNYAPSKKNGTVDYRPGKVVETKIKTPEGYKIELFADESMFPNLSNPVQLSFDNKGRLWVATMASYPHWKIGDPRPEDKLLILEDTDNDGKADKETIFAGDLHIPIGFEIAHDGVYVSQSGSLVFLQDTNGDDHYDTKEVILSGFDDHDTHHAISAFCVDPSGAIVMGEGVFLHSNVETAYGPVHATNGGFQRYSPNRKHLMRYAQYTIPNPWGVAYDDYGQDFFLHTSGTSLSWMLPGTVKPVYGTNLRAPDLITAESVRPTSGIEFVSSRHFPDEVQGDVILNNAIGYLGAKQHQVEEDGTGFTLTYRQDLFVSEDLNFRPVDLEFAPDGSLYVVDWHNALIGHMQHSARDPLRDHEHGRIYRVTYPSRPLVEPAKVAGASIEELFANLTLPEYRTRYRTRRELRGRDASEVLPALKKWAANTDDEHHKLEALWVSWGYDQVDQDLLKGLLASKDHKVRSAAVRVLRFNQHAVDDFNDLLLTAANDDHGRVRLEAITAASWLDRDHGLAVVTVAEAKGVDDFSKQSLEAARAVLTGSNLGQGETTLRIQAPKHLKGKDAKLYIAGAEVYNREAHCGTCHQANGMGLSAAGFPPLDGTRWVNGDPERLIKISLKGMMGPIEVKGTQYPGVVPMTPFEHILKDDELASVLTYVRNAWSNKSSAITPQQVAKVRAEVKEKIGFYSPEEILKIHPHKE